MFVQLVDANRPMKAFTQSLGINLREYFYHLERIGTYRQEIVNEQVQISQSGAPG
jgi:hypothetical protein